MPPLPAPAAEHLLKAEADAKNRGRRRSRNDQSQEETGELSPGEGEGDEEGDAADGPSSGTDGPSRKRRRSRKGLDKKFDCTQEGCGKSYSRAEHLSETPHLLCAMHLLTQNNSYRHQLNHTPKQIYSCEFPDCHRTFVRQDLCNRHRDRHTAKGSQLHRKDSMLGHGSPVTETGKPVSMHEPTSPETTRPGHAGAKPRTAQQQYQSPQEVKYQSPQEMKYEPTQEMNSNAYSPATNASSGTYSGTTINTADHFTQGGGFRRSNSDGVSRGSDSTGVTSNSGHQRHSSFGVLDAKPAEFARPPLQTTVGPYGLLSGPSSTQNYQSNQASSHPYVTPQNFPPFTLPPPTYPAATTSISTPRDTESYPTSMSTDYPSESIHHQQSGPDMMLLDQMTAPNTMPVFGGEGYNRSPFAIPEDFVAYLFSGQQLDGSSPISQMGGQAYAKLVPGLICKETY